MNQVVIDVVRAFPGRRIVPGDVFVIDFDEPEWPVAEVRYHSPDAIAWLGRHADLLRCRELVCVRCPFGGACKRSRPGKQPTVSVIRLLR